MDTESPERSAERTLAQWTSLLAEGDDEAWRWFHARYYLTLLRYAVHRSGDAAAASEIVQQAYLRIARHAKPFTSDEAFSNWLSCLVRCAAVDHTRHKARRHLLAERFAHWRASQDGPDTAWHASMNGEAALAEEALAQLPAEDAELLRKKYCHGSTTEELASELGATPKAIERRLARLRARLMDIILRIR
ncbi:RNA polymerase sigma factor (sigma-70 family) [Roseimicrobium gellanilyticum]|uniref:RNA polymerase sigma factor (Sigma-70 family) n=1 Tax=Roseimicrobium gellanilyticum TaxID=748857 RepID=A0A366HRL9_9BACT|nr:sigma-70 family RNA polymerase sigma factor [Roseimicrobium gellanilyticum]RBP45419.1 RNA polymerase sigma factor (sigma-70 family) [Roseimicrobium gellanilyticum]